MRAKTMDFKAETLQFENGLIIDLVPSGEGRWHLYYYNDRDYQLGLKPWKVSEVGGETIDAILTIARYE